MSLSRLIDVLDRSGVEIEAYAILDALWLAQYRPSFGAVPNAAPTVRTQVGAGEPPSTVASSTGKFAHSPNKNHRLLRGGRPDETKQATADLDPISVAAYAGGDPFGSGRRASAMLTIGAAPLFDALSFQRALRPFRDRIASHQAAILDEEATAERSAELSLRGPLRLVPVIVPARERWFQVDLVIEEDAAAEVWRETLSAFAQTMRDSGAFRDVREWKLDLGEGGQGRAMLYASSGAVLPAAALSGNDGRLILFASHGGSTHWLTGAYARLLIGWAKACAVALIHLLEPQQWARTPLGEPNALAVTYRPGVINVELATEPFWWLPAEETAQTTPFPLVELSPRGVGEWAAMLMARGGPSPATLLAAGAAQFREPSEEDEAVIQRRVGALLSTAPQAFQLAVLLSSAPFTIPVARLIQEAHFGRSDHQALAQLFVSGLLRLHPGQSRTASSPWFLIHPAAAATLRRSLKLSDVEAIGRTLIQRVSDHIARATGSRPPMTSFVLDERGDSALPDWAKPFALVAARLKSPRAHTGPSLPTEALKVATDRILGLDPKSQKLLVQLATKNLALEGAAIPPRAWSLLLDRALTEIDSEGERRFTEAARTIVAQIDRDRPLLGARILWVDDRPRNNARLARQMKAEGATITTALSTEQAMNQTIGEFDVIISDMARKQGDREGFVLLSALHARNVRTPVIIFAARFAASRENRAAAASAGAYYTTNDGAALVRHVRRLCREPGTPADETFSERERAPLDWATTQDNFGSALRALGERDEALRIRRNKELAVPGLEIQIGPNPIGLEVHLVQRPKRIYQQTSLWGHEPLPGPSDDPITKDYVSNVLGAARRLPEFSAEVESLEARFDPVRSGPSGYDATGYGFWYLILAGHVTVRNPTKQYLDVTLLHHREHVTDDRLRDRVRELAPVEASWMAVPEAITVEFAPFPEGSIPGPLSLEQLEHSIRLAPGAPQEIRVAVRIAVEKVPPMDSEDSLRTLGASRGASRDDIAKFIACHALLACRYDNIIKTHAVFRVSSRTVTLPISIKIARSRDTKDSNNLDAFWQIDNLPNYLDRWFAAWTAGSAALRSLLGR